MALAAAHPPDDGPAATGGQAREQEQEQERAAARAGARVLLGERHALEACRAYWHVVLWRLDSEDEAGEP